MGAPHVPSEADLREEYRHLREDLQHASGRADAARTFGVAAIGAILTLSIQQRLGVVALAGAVFTYLFALVDLVNAFRYELRAQRARRIELALDAYEEVARHDRDEASTALLEGELLDLGKRPFQTELNEPGRHAMAFAHPRPVFKYLYPGLLLGSALLAVWLQVRNGSAAETAGTGFAAATLLAVCLPRFLDPTKYQIARWRTGRASVSQRAASYGLPLLAAVLLAFALLAAIPAIKAPPSQVPGRLSVGLAPGAAAHVELILAPSCARGQGRLVVSWRGSARDLAVRLPQNVESLEGRRTLSQHLAASPISIPIATLPSSQAAGRCTFAVPALVGSGMASYAVARIRLPANEGGLEVSGLPASFSARLGPCATIGSRDPAADCSGVLHLADADSDRERLWRVALAALALFLALAMLGYVAVRRAAPAKSRWPAPAAK
jgi:hypothetical protein